MKLYASGIEGIPNMRITENFGMVVGLYDGKTHFIENVERDHSDANAVINVRSGTVVQSIDTTKTHFSGDAVRLEPKEPEPSQP